ncbi:MAG: methyltransferase domain-containing protein [Chloroflexi bacterium]|nr:methyltransferase domain-containing protein [Chloroflexota bacterium]
MTDDRLERFLGHYSSGHTPWDTGITPPEIEQIAAELPPGKALDLGCGTGTNVGYLLARGWQADGIDFVPQAVEIARDKLAAFPPEQFSILCYDVTRLDECPDLRAPYNLAVDIGCGHGLPLESQAQYAKTSPICWGRAAR